MKIGDIQSQGRSYVLMNSTVAQSTNPTSIINYDTITTDELGEATATRFTAQNAGKYLAVFRCHWGLPETWHALMINKNGVSQEIGYHEATSLDNAAFQISAVIDMAIGDYLETTAFGQAGGNNANARLFVIRIL